MGIDALIGGLLSGLGEGGGAAAAAAGGVDAATTAALGTIAAQDVAETALLSAAAPELTSAATAAGVSAADLATAGGGVTGSLADIAAASPEALATGDVTGAAAAAAPLASVSPSAISSAATPSSVIGTAPAADITGSAAPLSTAGGSAGGVGGAAGVSAPASVGSASPDVLSQLAAQNAADLPAAGATEASGAVSSVYGPQLLEIGGQNFDEAALFNNLQVAGVSPVSAADYGAGPLSTWASGAADTSGMDALDAQAAASPLAQPAIDPTATTALVNAPLPPTPPPDILAAEQAAQLGAPTSASLGSAGDFLTGSTLSSTDPLLGTPTFGGDYGTVAGGASGTISDPLSIGSSVLGNPVSTDLSSIYGTLDTTPFGAPPTAIGFNPAGVDTLSPDAASSALAQPAVAPAATTAAAPSSSDISQLSAAMNAVNAPLDSTAPLSDSALNYVQPSAADVSSAAPAASLPTSAPAGAGTDASLNAANGATTLTSSAPGTTTATGGGIGGGASTASGGNWLSTLGSQIAKNPLQDAMLALGAGGLIYDIAKGNQKPPDYNELQTEAAQANSQSQLLENYLTTGTLPPGMQAAITAATNSAQAAIKSQMANAGMSGSSAEAQALQTAQQTAVSQGASIALQLYNTGLSQAQLADQIYETIMQTAIQQDAALSQAIGTFAGSLAGSSLKIPTPTATA